MKEHLRFSVVYWHTFANPLSDPFGVGTALRPWDDGAGGMDRAKTRVKVAFEFFGKLGVPFYAFHDRDVAPEGATLKESHANLDEIVKLLKDEMGRTGVKLLLGHLPTCSPTPRYAHGRGHQPEPRRLRLRRGSAGQEGSAAGGHLDLGGLGYTFWGGREGYSTLWNTDLKREVGPPRPVPPHGGSITRKHDRLQTARSISSRSPRSRPSTSPTPTPPPASTSCGPTGCSRTSSSTWRRTTPPSPATR